MSNITMLILIVFFLQSTLSFSNLGISEEDYPNLAIGAKILMICFSLTLTITSGIIKTYNWKDIV